MALEAAGLFEALQPVYALITPIYESRRDFASLSVIYHHLGRAYDAIAKAESTGQRLFASYYRVTFLGKVVFCCCVEYLFVKPSELQFSV